MKKSPKKTKVLFISGFGPIVRDQKSSRKLYAEDLGLSFTEEEGGYLHTEEVEGAKTFVKQLVAAVKETLAG